MKVLLFLGALLCTTFPVLAKGLETISKNIDFVSTKWVDTKGTFRVIVFNSEDDPCFILENYKEGTSGSLTSSHKFCRVLMADKHIIDVSKDNIGDTWFERFSWSGHELQFMLNTADGEYLCGLDLYLYPSKIAQCRLLVLPHDSALKQYN
ncbi:hypothetical protein C0Z01_14865 [Photobacterium kishitanii]|uniref:Uncharacterized protein n=1 Tax=Photobacterium kishitanii TaxID=318456 RepID=A0A0B7J713_9GAMM|nr:hypothetical protein [Photobacterium kishitanii]OBU27566.1 hypothetical protein AYY22_16255 [Photobacterium kishitanii]PSU93834.1 hypothetical protein C9J27_20740 [Photobacterium kishitanii]PSU96606.1 hypothetical protein C0W35_04155 [Photobacterium kishitanii]PSW68479.1 hypothetical protein C0Z01_14865 [Photobacterium kishitanii]CEO38830.1 conserved exported hypothetical protein [Photobacterium kishitanii]